MVIEQQLKDLMISRYGSVRAFCTYHDIPYSTVANIFKRGIGSLGLYTAQRICDFLGLDIDKFSRGILSTKEVTYASLMNTENFVIPAQLIMSIPLIQVLEKFCNKHDIPFIKVLDYYEDPNHLSSLETLISGNIAKSRDPILIEEILGCSIGDALRDMGISPDMYSSLLSKDEYTLIKLFRAKSGYKDVILALLSSLPNDNITSNDIDQNTDFSIGDAI